MTIEEFAQYRIGTVEHFKGKKCDCCGSRAKGGRGGITNFTINYEEKSVTFRIWAERGGSAETILKFDKEHEEMSIEDYVKYKTDVERIGMYIPLNDETRVYKQQMQAMKKKIWGDQA